MVASGVSFSLYYLLYTRRRFDVVLDRELLAYLGILLGAVLFVWGCWSSRASTGHPGVEHCATRPSRSRASHDDRVRHGGLRQVGHSGEAHPSCSCSSVAAPVLSRRDKGHPVIVIFRTILQDIFRMVHPRAVTPLVVGGRMVPEGIRLAVLGLFAAWIAIFGAASLLVALQDNLTLTSSATAVAATLNVIGPGWAKSEPQRASRSSTPSGVLCSRCACCLGGWSSSPLWPYSPAFWKR